MSMIVMPGNGWASQLAATYPNRMGMLFTPTEKRKPRGLPFGIDNGRFLQKKNGWDEAQWLATLDWCVERKLAPMWVVVPDVLGDGDATFKEWEKYAPRLRDAYGWPLAIAVQNNMHPREVTKRKPDVIFVGGTTIWKWKTLRTWTSHFSIVHCGRVNQERTLWAADEAGCSSVDGSGFFRGHSKEQEKPIFVDTVGLFNYLAQSSAGKQRSLKGFGRR